MDDENVEIEKITFVYKWMKWVFLIFFCIMETN